MTDWTGREKYWEFVARMFAKKHEGEDGLMHAAVGTSGEAGEILDAVKKHWVYGKTLDRAHLMEEIGDVLFYLTALCNLLGTNLSECIAGNMDKLNKRYPAGYTDAAAIARADKDEFTTSLQPMGTET